MCALPVATRWRDSHSMAAAAMAQRSRASLLLPPTPPFLLDVTPTKQSKE